MKNYEWGTVISGTMRPQDLIPAFLDVLEECGHPDYTIFREEYIKKDDSWFYSEDCSEYLEELWDAMDNCAPVGHYFGSHPGDGSDYGFWENEE